MNVRKLRGSDLEETIKLFSELIPLAFSQEDEKVDWSEAIAEEIRLKTHKLHEACYNVDSQVRFLVAVESPESQSIMGAIAYYPLGSEIRQVITKKDERLSADGERLSADFEGLCELGSLYVRPEYRDMGVASSLINGMMMWLQSEGIEAFALDSGFTHAIPKWLKRFGEPYIIAKDFWGAGKDHYVWRCKVVDQLAIELKPFKDKRAIWNFLQSNGLSAPPSQFAFIPANLHFDAACCQGNLEERFGTYYGHFYHLTMKGELMGLVMFETIEVSELSNSSEPSGYWDWVLTPKGSCYAQMLLHWLHYKYPKLDTTMAYLNDQWIYEGVGWHLGTYARYVGMHSLVEMPERPLDYKVFEAMGLTLEALGQGESINSDEPTSLDDTAEDVAELIAMATSCEVSSAHYRDLMSHGRMPDDGRLSQWAAREIKSGKVVAYVAFWMDLKTQRGALEPVACAPQWRGLGVSKALLSLGLWQLKEWGCQSVSVSTSQGNNASQALYRSVGFERFDWLATYRRPLSKKKAIVFDLYGTLVDIATDEEQAQLWEGMAHYYNGLFKAEALMYSPQSLKAKYATLVAEEIQAAKARASQLHGRPVEHVDFDLLKVFNKLAGDSVSENPLADPKVAALLFRSLSRSKLGAYPNAVALLEWLSANDYQIVLLSNAQQCFTQLELQATGLASLFHAIYLSSDYGLTKPEPAYFEKMLQDLNLSPDACLFVGNDHLADLGGAKSVGMDCVYLHTSCSQGQIPDWLPGHLLLMDGDLSRLLQYFQALEAHYIKE